MHLTHKSNQIQSTKRRKSVSHFMQGTVKCGCLWWQRAELGNPAEPSQSHSYVGLDRHSRYGVKKNTPPNNAPPPKPAVSLLFLPREGKLHLFVYTWMLFASPLHFNKSHSDHDLYSVYREKLDIFFYCGKYLTHSSNIHIFYYCLSPW